MKKIAIIFLLLAFSLTAYAQRAAEKTSATPPMVEKTPLDEETEFRNARALVSLTDRIAALKKFTEDFPESDKRTLALELIVSSRAELGDQKLRLSDNQSGIELFKTAVAEAPVPVSDKLFNEIVLQFPTNLFFRGQRAAAFETAELIEEKIDGNAAQLLALAAFYLGTEYAAEAKRIALKVIEIDPESAAAYQTLGLASRINFDLEESAAAYKKSLELNPDSLVSKRSLAEMKRAAGRADESAALYREILEKDPADASAQTGLILSLFNADRRNEAETEMAKAFETNPDNLFLLVGAAYWYAAHEEGAKALELAQKAVALEPRYTWAHIALARALIEQKRPLEAERTLLLARQYGNFPTLNYEIAAARLAAGFYREAADELKKSFTVRDGLVSAKLGGRIPKTGESFTEVLSFERRASIFEPVAADDPASAEKLKSLLAFSQKFDSDEPDETEITQAAEKFLEGEDGMRVYRGLYIADRLLEKRIALPKVLEMTAAAVGKVDASLDIPSPAAAVMADELYEMRVIAEARNELLVVPDVPRQTLSRILRGRIEELAGWALLQQNKPEEAAVRFKRAVSILPGQSAWWRSSKWRLGAALDAGGKSEDALRAYIESYDAQAPDVTKRIVIESLYEKVNGSTEGLDEIIGARPVSGAQREANVAQNAEKPSEIPTPSPMPSPISALAKIPENVPVAKERQNAENPVQSEEKSVPAPETETLTIPENVPTIKTEPETEETRQDGETQPAAEIAENTEKEITDDPPASSPEKEETVESDTEPEPAPAPETVSEDETAPPTDPAPEESKKAENVPVVSDTPEPAPEDETPAETSPEVSGNSETNADSRQAENIVKAVENTSAPKTQTSLFDPVIISVPKVEKKNVESKNAEESTERNSAETVEEEPAAETAEVLPEKSLRNLTSRPRIASESKSEPDQETENPAPCAVNVSQKDISILNGGGSLGMFVGFEGAGGDIKQLTARSSSPQNVAIEFQPDIGVITKRAFYIIKSISSKTGIYTVTFDSNCGRKEIIVTVR